MNRLSEIYLNFCEEWILELLLTIFFAIMVVSILNIIFSYFNNLKGKTFEILVYSILDNSLIPAGLATKKNNSGTSREGQLLFVFNENTMLIQELEIKYDQIEKAILDPSGLELQFVSKTEKKQSIKLAMYTLNDSYSIAVLAKKLDSRFLFG